MPPDSNAVRLSKLSCAGTTSRPMKTYQRRRARFALALAALALNSYFTRSSGAASWIASSPMAIARFNHTATLLPNGKVLVVGGRDASGSLPGAELYDPATGKWTAAGGINPRENHTATLLPNGKVLIAAGYVFRADSPLPSAELYDPATGTSTMTGPLNTARNNHTAILLPNGKVLVAGGQDNNGATNSAELYDPDSGTWTPTGPLNAARTGHTATLLPDGTVLIAGGFNGYGGDSFASAELYDAAAGAWTPTSPLNTARNSHTATLLPNGKVLIAGGVNGAYPNAIYFSNAELYDPATGAWTPTGPLTTARSTHTATLLPD